MQAARDLPPAAMQALFKADVKTLPAFVGASVNGSYMLYQIVKVSQPEKVDGDKLKGLQREYGAIVAQQTWRRILPTCASVTRSTSTKRRSKRKSASKRQDEGIKKAGRVIIPAGFFTGRSAA